MPLPSSSNTGEERGEQRRNRGNYQMEISGQTIYQNPPGKFRVKWEK